SLMPIFLIEDRKQVNDLFFVRFIKVLDVNRLVNNLYTVWVGRHKLQANIPRFQKEHLKRHISLHNIDGVKRGNSRDTYNSNGVKGAANSYVHVVRGSQNSKMDSDSSPVLVLDDSCLNEKYYSFCLLGKDVLLDVDDQEDEHFHRKRICINTNVLTNIFETFKLIYRGKVFWVRAKEVPGWIPDFVKDNDEDEDSEVGSYEEVPNGEDVKNVEDLEGDSDGELVPDTKFEEDFPNQKGKEDSVGQGNVQSEDPFNIYELLNHKRPVIDKNSNSKESLKYPLGYTPTGSKEATGEKQFDSKKIQKNDVEESICSGHFKKSEVPKSDYFVMVRGDWMPNGKKLLIISVYAPQELSEKKMLWDYLSLVLSNWEGEVVIMGDYNEVRNKSKRFEMLFNRHGADVFNRFISNAGLEEVPLEGLLCSCPNISSITLDRYLSDHRLILMREVYYDYGPVPFRFFHYWFEVDGFDKFIEDSLMDAPIIESNALVRMMKKLNYLKDKIREGENNIVNRRTEVVNLLQEVKKKNSLEATQKAKIKWAIEGDENSKYYHGVINKKRNPLSICGILVEGTWIDSPSLMKYAVTCFFHQGSFPK
nr:RNA-directed DNA polymerase, eukaryota [Tanacetum cinerariifolium]